MRNDEKWPHTRQIKIAGRNHILPGYFMPKLPVGKLKGFLHKISIRFSQVKRTVTASQLIQIIICLNLIILLSLRVTVLARTVRKHNVLNWLWFGLVRSDLTFK
jgi:hypothetical protein